ncbi:MAG: heat-inducible transcriptional repressor HrcA [Candidatus Methylomirabilales bacterium]
MPAKVWPEELSEREREVLRVITEEHIVAGEPVGSRSVTRKHGFHLSPATIRNIMADLEEMGYLAQPHTSAGRIPTDLGYRFYVDFLMNRCRLSRAEEHRIERQFAPVREAGEPLLETTTGVLSNLSQVVGIVLGPRADQVAIRQVEFIHLVGERILVILITQSGHVERKVIVIDEVLSQEELGRIARCLNDIVEGLTLREVRKRLVERMEEERAQYDDLLRRALSLGQRTFMSSGAGEVYIRGTANIMDQPEFADIEKMRALFAAFEDKARLVKILDACLAEQGLTIRIGSENSDHHLQGLSLVIAPYGMEMGMVGVVGVIGPTRMEYSKIIPLVDFTARLVERYLSEGSA